MIQKKNAQANFSFIAKNPPALLIAGGILIYILGDPNFGGFLIFLGFILQIIWITKGRLF